MVSCKRKFLAFGIGFCFCIVDIIMRIMEYSFKVNKKFQGGTKNCTKLPLGYVHAVDTVIVSISDSPRSYKSCMW